MGLEPKEFQKTCIEWEYTNDWQTKVELVDKTFGNIYISNCD